MEGTNMKASKLWRCVSLMVVLSLTFSFARMTTLAAPADKPASPYRSKVLPETLPAWFQLSLVTVTPPPTREPPPPFPSRLSPGRVDRNPAPHVAAHTLVTPTEVFTNTWSYSTIGLVYDPGRNHVRYAHESQSSTHNPTIYDVAYPLPHTLLVSIALSTLNSGWPWQLDNRTGAGYDFTSDTYFLPDYNGDLSYADDNIVEITLNGTILNAWEMDDEVYSNDSSDGSEIDSIIDIAVVPGSPTRYFATAAYDSNVVYEIELVKTGTWWTPNSWRTVATCTVPLTDNLGIDYDAQNEVLYHADWHSTKIVVTDLACSAGDPMNVLAEFNCPGAGGYNSGVTFIEGQGRVWVTDFSSDQTTVCPSPYGEGPPEPGWWKEVIDPAGVRHVWDPDLAIQTETTDTFTVIDVITATDPFTLTELWNPANLRLVDVVVDPPVGQVVTGTGLLQVSGPAGPPEVVTVIKRFHVEPCSWLTTTVEEMLEIGTTSFPARPFVVAKTPPVLEISSEYFPQVLAGSVASFTLIYSNTGGYENNVSIVNTFPITAPFAFSDPPPDEVRPDGSVEWRVGDLARGDRGTIDVFFFIDETLTPSTTIAIWDGIFDHTGELLDWVVSEFHVEEYTPPPVNWTKLVNGEPWYPGISLTLETSQTFEVIDSISPDPLNTLILIEEWNPERLQLEFFIPPPYGNVITTPNSLTWIIPPNPDPAPIDLIKIFHVETCLWEETVLWEELVMQTPTEILPVGTRPVLVNKIPPDLWIGSTNNSGPDVYGGEEVSFTLSYGNDGGNEEFVIIRNTFPPEAPFVWSDPPPTFGGPGDPVIEWILPDDPGQITVTVRIIPGLPPSTTIEIWDGIFNHAGELEGETVITYHVPPPEWWKWVNDQPWTPGFGVPVYTSDTITVTDVISTRSDIALVEFWNPERMTLLDFWTDPAGGIIQVDPGFISWEFPEGAPGTVTMTKLFHVEPCTWTYTVLWEEVWVAGEEWERRPVHVDKPDVALVIDSFFDVDVMAGERAEFELQYTNLFTSDVEFGAWISNTFPAEAPFAGSSLDPSSMGDNWVAWDLPPLEPGATGSFTVAVDVDPGLPPSTTLEIWDGIFNHAGDLEDDTVITLHVEPPEPAWAKEIWIDGEVYTPGDGPFPMQPDDTFTIVDRVWITNGAPISFTLVEEWSAEMALQDAEWSAGSTLSGTGRLDWYGHEVAPNTWHVLTKTFQFTASEWVTSAVTETLRVHYVDLPPGPVMLEFPMGSPSYPIYLPLVVKNS
jgi:hypothetical protein